MLLLVADFFLHLCFIATFIVLAYFSVGTWVAKENIISQMQLVAQRALNAVNVIDNPLLNVLLTGMIDKFVPEGIAAADAEIAARNMAILLFIVPIAVGFFALTFGLAWVFCSLAKSSFKKLLFDNLILLCSVAIVELTFMLVIIKNYRTLDMNFIKRTVIERAASESDRPIAMF